MNGDRALRLKIRERYVLGMCEQRGAYTFVEILWHGIRGYGFSKHNPNDKDNPRQKYDAQKGMDYALNKAIEDVVRQYNAQTAKMLPPDVIRRVPHELRADMP